MKHQITSTKHQISSNRQISIFPKKPLLSLEIGALFGIWILGLGIWNTTHRSKVKIIPFLLMLAMVLLVLVGCGKKGPPVPLGTVVPKRIVDLQASVREGRVLLEWTAPRENTDKTPLVDLKEFTVFRSEGSLVDDSCRGCGERKTVVGQLQVTGEEAKGKKFHLLFEGHEPKKVYVYEVVSINRKGHAGSPSNPVLVYWDYPPEPPSTVSAERGDRRVDLHWEAVLGAMGYDVYRAEEGQEFSIQPLNREPLAENRYTDLGVENEKRYVYSIRSVRRVVKTDVEGRGSPGISIAVTDLVPPSSPSGLVAVPVQNGIELRWNQNPESDLLGYFIYRRRIGEKDFERLNDDPLKNDMYLDTTVQMNQEYEYALTAVDHSVGRNESAFSEPVRVLYSY